MGVASTKKRRSPIRTRSQTARTSLKSRLRRWLIPAIVAAAVFGCIIAYFLAKEWYIFDVETKDITFKVTSEATIGFDTNTSALTFGKIPLGGGSERKATLVSSIPAIAHIRVDPDYVRDAVIASSYRVYLDPVVPAEVTFNAVVPNDMPLGTHNGTLTITYTRRMPWE